jgi:hypothetical protein
LIRKGIVLGLFTNNLLGNDDTYPKRYQLAYDKFYGDWIKERRLRKERSAV